MTGGESSSESPIEHQPTGEDRVRMVARQVSKPRTVNWIASEADWSHGPTKRVLEHLVDDGILHRDDTGGHTKYFPDYRRQALTEAIRLRDSDYTVEDLTERLTEMNAQIRGWKDEFDVEYRTNFAGGSLTRYSTSPKRIFAERSRVSGNSSNGESKLWVWLSESGTF